MLFLLTAIFCLSATVAAYLAVGAWTGAVPVRWVAYPIGGALVAFTWIYMTYGGVVGTHIHYVDGETGEILFLQDKEYCGEETANIGYICPLKEGKVHVCDGQEVIVIN